MEGDGFRGEINKKSSAATLAPCIVLDHKLPGGGLVQVELFHFVSQFMTRNPQQDGRLWTVAAGLL